LCEIRPKLNAWLYTTVLHIQIPHWYKTLFKSFRNIYKGISNYIRSNSYTLDRAKYWDKPEQSKLDGFFPILSCNFWDRLRLKLLAIPNRAPCTKYWIAVHRLTLRIRQRNRFSIWTTFSDSLSIWKFIIQAKAFKVIRCCISIGFITWSFRTSKITSAWPWEGLWFLGSYRWSLFWDGGNKNFSRIILKMHGSSCSNADFAEFM
jgi:hypothetical protein